MPNIVNYALAASDTFVQRPLCRVDSLCFSWLAYLRFPEGTDVASEKGVRVAELGEASLRSKLMTSLHDVESSSMLVQALALSPRFRDVRVCLHLSDVDETQGRQLAATTFVLPDDAGTYVAFRGTDNTLTGWKENLRLATSEPVPSQRGAAAYLNRIGADATGPLYVGGHSKGGNLAVYAAGMVRDEVRAKIAMCFSHDGPGLSSQLIELTGWDGSFSLDKTVPGESLVGMLFERSQEGLVVVRSSKQGVLQHSPFSWEVQGNDFVLEQGMDYGVWRLGQRLNDWLDALGEAQRKELVELIVWLMDATGENSFSGLLARWQGNARAMSAALDGAPSGDKELFSRAMDDLVATITLGSAREYERPDAGTPAAADAAARRLEDLSAKVNDRLSKLDRLTGR